MEMKNLDAEYDLLTANCSSSLSIFSQIASFQRISTKRAKSGTGTRLVDVTDDTGLCLIAKLLV